MMSRTEAPKVPFPLGIPSEEGVIRGPLQRRVEQILMDLADSLSKETGTSRRSFLATASGMAAAFMAMNMVHGPLFRVDPAEAADPGAASRRRDRLKDQFIFDVQTHFVSDDYSRTGLLGLREQAKQWNPQLRGDKQTLDDIRYDNYVREVFMESDTTIALLSSAPADDPASWFLHNPELMRAREKVNGWAGSKRLLAHAIFIPGQPGWLEELDKAIALRPDSWKGYTLGSPSGSRWPWRLDNEKLVYPAYERMLKAGIPIVCIHKGLLPRDYRNRIPAWRYGGPGDIGKAAKDWPEVTFVIYHSAIRSGQPPTKREVAQFEKTGYIPWVSELARIPGELGVTNVYAELGSVFAVTAISNPRYCAGILGTLLKGFGHERILWGTDSVWYGSPQWQIEALRRLEIPGDVRRRFGFPELGPADGVVKRAILGGNAARLYGIGSSRTAFSEDRIAALKCGVSGGTAEMPFASVQEGGGMKMWNRRMMNRRGHLGPVNRPPGIVSLLLPVLFLLHFSPLFAAETAPPVTFGEGVEVAVGRGELGSWQQNNSRYDYVDDPTATVDDRGFITVAWVDQKRKDVFVQRFSPEGRERVGRPVNVSRSGETFSWLPRIAVHPNEQRKLYVLWQEIIFSGGSHGGDILFARSADGGKRFSRPLNLSRSVGGDGKGRINREIWHNGSLDLAVGADGTVFAAWTEYAGTLWFCRSTDGGRSFTKPIRVAGNDTIPARAPSLATGSGGTIYLAWTTGDDKAADIHITSSSDRGATFAEPLIVAETAGYSDAPKLAVDAKGVLHLTFGERAGGPFQAGHVLYTRSADRGRTFESPRQVSGSTTGAGFPSLEVDRKGRLYLIWELFPDHREPSRGLGVTVSSDGGRTFSPPAVVEGSIDPGRINGNLQGLLMKKLAVNRAGTIVIATSSFRKNEVSRVWLIPGRL